MLAQLGAEQAWKLHRDPVMLSELTTARPPGSSDLLPEWAIGAAREASKAAYLEKGRSRTTTKGAKKDDGHAGGGGDDGAPGGPRQR
eukprot:2899069-Alexandrium_andersonii.AAC.1